MLVVQRTLWQRSNLGPYLFQVVGLCTSLRHSRASLCAVGPLVALLLQLFFWAAPARAVSPSQDQRKEPVGSLETTGEVFVNDAPAPIESTIFAGDTVRTETGTAIFNMSGNGTLKIASQTQVQFPGGFQLLAVLQKGTVIIDSISGPSGVKLLVGNFMVVPAVRSRVTAARVERQADGQFLVTCLDGDISTISVNGASGKLLEVGQYVSISPQGVLLSQKGSPIKSYAQAQPAHANASGPGKKIKGSWTLLGLAGAGAGAAALVLGHGGGGQSVSPSTP